MTKAYKLQPEFKRIHDMVRDWAHAVADQSYDGSWGCGEVENIENEHVSGFVPFTEGGAEVVLNADLGSCVSSGSAPSMIQPFIDSATKEIEDLWQQGIAWLKAAGATIHDISLPHTK